MITTFLNKSNLLTTLLTAAVVMAAGYLYLIPQMVLAQASDPLYRVTMGTEQSSMPVGQGIEDLSSHGFRFVCVPSHFSYDDPVVYPGQAGAAHLHMFFGNTGVDYLSTSESIVNTGRVTCAGGLTNRSAYWVPALFNENGEPVLSSFIINYYKSWISNRNELRPIPAGLQILANDQVQGSNGTIIARPGHPEDVWPADIGVYESDEGGVNISVSFPDCIAVDSNGDPVLTSPDATSHMAYANGSSCPDSHPYHIPTLTQNMRWHTVPYESDWYLASDPGPEAQGTTAHADYMAAWTPEAAQIMVDCVRDGHRECGPPLEYLPGEFSNSPSGEEIYAYQNLVRSADSTPLGQWPKTLDGSPANSMTMVTNAVQATSDTAQQDQSVTTSAGAASSQGTASNNPVPGVFNGGDKVVTTDSLNLRKSPGGEVVKVIPEGTSASIPSWHTPRDKDGQEWTMVFTDGSWGYVATDFIEHDTGVVDTDADSASNIATVAEERFRNIRTIIQQLLKRLEELQAQLEALQAQTQG